MTNARKIVALMAHRARVARHTAAAMHRNKANPTILARADAHRFEALNAYRAARHLLDSIE